MSRPHWAPCKRRRKRRKEVNSSIRDDHAQIIRTKDVYPDIREVVYYQRKPQSAEPECPLSTSFALRSILRRFGRVYRQSRLQL